MLNIGVGSILTNGLGGSAFNLLTFGPFNLYIAPLQPPTPTPTPEPPISSGGGAAFPGYYEEEKEEESRYYKLTLNFKLTKRKSVTRSFIVDKHQQDIIVRRLGKINTAILKFKVTFKYISRVFRFKWKK